MANRKSNYVSRRMKKRAEQRRKKRLVQFVVIGLAVILMVGYAWALLTRETPALQDAQSFFPMEVSVDEAHEMYQTGAFFLDVRTPEEWSEYHIPGATLIPLEELENRVDEVPADQDVVVVCRSGNRSQMGRDILRSAGLGRVTSMSGGVRAWVNAGYPSE